MKKKILFVSFWYPTAKQPHKGIFVREYAAALAQNGHHVIVFVLDFQASPTIFKIKKEISKDISGFDVHRLTIFSFAWKLIYFINPFLNKLSFKYIKEKLLPYFIPDIIHAHVINPAGIIAYHLSKKIKKPYIITEHWSDVGIFFKSTRFPKMALNAYNYSSFITVVSEYLKNDIASYISDKDKLMVIPNIIGKSFNYRGFSENDCFVCTSVGKWEYPKNLQMIADALKKFSAISAKPIKYNIVGDGSLLKLLLDNKRNYSFEIISHGVLDKESIAVLFSRSDILLHCSEVETFSVVIAEAHSCGLPVLASNRGAMPELIDVTNGMVCENTLDDWVSALKKITNIVYDRNQISENAKKRYDTDNIIESLNNLYNQL